MTEDSWYYIFLICLILAYPLGQLAAEVVNFCRGEKDEDEIQADPKHAGH
jgi:hypothetical protein